MVLVAATAAVLVVAVLELVVLAGWVLQGKDLLVLTEVLVRLVVVAVQVPPVRLVRHHLLVETVEAERLVL
jgi:hypothetical protein